MRVLADFAGIYGFCFSHYWANGSPQGQQVLQQILKDGEPDKPFFLYWSNGIRMSPMGAASRSYTSTMNMTETMQHFEYLLPFFSHPNYIRIDGKPVFAIEDINAESAPILASTFREWGRMARISALKGLYFIRFLTSADGGNIFSEVIFNGHMEVEPRLSWVLQENRYDINGSVEYTKSPLRVYNKHSTWRAIENRAFWGYQNTYFGTFYSFNNAPVLRMRQFTDTTTPVDVVLPDSGNGFHFHLRYMIDKVNAESPGEKLLLLSSWNDWAHQSVIEPNDVDGYDALMSLKKAMGVRNDSIIAHVSNHREDRMKDQYITDIMFLYMDYLHMRYSFHVLLQLIEVLDITVLHVHSALLGRKAPKWAILELLRRCKNLSTDVFLTIHDYQYLLPSAPLPSTEELALLTPTLGNLVNTSILFNLANIIVFPSARIRNYYVSQLQGLMGSAAEGISSFIHKIHTVPHMEPMADHDCVRVPKSMTTESNASINVALLSDSLQFEERVLFNEIFANLPSFHISGLSVTMRYVLFDNKAGARDELAADQRRIGNLPILNESSRDPLEVLNEAAQKQFFNADNPYGTHIVLCLSKRQDPYSYKMAKIIRSGLPLVYFEDGTMASMLGNNSKYPKYFPVLVDSTRDAIFSRIKEAALFAVQRSLVSESDCSEKSRSKIIQPSKWYLNHYPTEFRRKNK